MYIWGFGIILDTSHKLFFMRYPGIDISFGPVSISITQCAYKNKF